MYPYAHVRARLTVYFDNVGGHDLPFPSRHCARYTRFIRPPHSQETRIKMYIIILLGSNLNNITTNNYCSLFIHFKNISSCRPCHEPSLLKIYDDDDNSKSNRYITDVISVWVLCLSIQPQCIIVSKNNIFVRTADTLVK